jgi:hypothetical protein
MKIVRNVSTGGGSEDFGVINMKSSICLLVYPTLYIFAATHYHHSCNRHSLCLLSHFMHSCANGILYSNCCTHRAPASAASWPCRPLSQPHVPTANAPTAADTFQTTSGVELGLADCFYASCQGQHLQLTPLVGALTGTSCWAQFRTTAPKRFDTNMVV